MRRLPLFCLLLCFVFGQIIPSTIKQTLNCAGCIFIAAAQSMGVHFQRGAGVRVPQARGHCHDVDAVGQQDGGVGVPLRYNYDKPEKPRRIKGFEVFSLVFSSFSKPKNHTEISRIVGGVSLTTNE